MVYEHHRTQPLSRGQFIRRLVGHLGLAGALVGLSVLGGMVGYRHFEGLSWLDGFLETAMLLGGMGAIHPPQTDGGKLFAGCFALYAGLIFIVTAAIMLAPMAHRIMHRLHWDEERDEP
jgi:hypothetical protein